jgi:hypothetical protein
MRTLRRKKRHGQERRNYRQFERLVARIESALVPSGAIIKSPDTLADLLTGEMREVDVSIRSKVGSVEVLISVECRDRVKTEDVTWIEQLATKQKQVGATHTIAVSSTGFSEPALKAARFHRISTRTIADVTDAEIRAWAEKLEVEQTETNCQLGRMALTCFGRPEGTVKLDAPSLQMWSERGWDAPVFVELATSRVLTLPDLIAKANKAQGHVLEPVDGFRGTIPPKGNVVIPDDPLSAIVRDIPRDGSKVERTIWIGFEPNEIAVHTTAGLLSVQKLGFEIVATSSRRPVPTARVLQYTDGSRTLGHVAERVVWLGRAGKEFVITSYRAAPAVEGSSEEK